MDEVTVNSILVRLQEIKLALGDKGAFQRFWQCGQTTMANSPTVNIASDQPAADVVTIGSLKAVRVILTSGVDGGLTPYHLVSASGTNATNVKASAGQIYQMQVYNNNASARYVKLYNKASAPSVGGDTVIKTLEIPGNTTGAGFVIEWAEGLNFSTGIAFGLTTGIGDSDSTGVGANDIVINIDYK